MMQASSLPSPTIHSHNMVKLVRITNSLPLVTSRLHSAFFFWTCTQS